MTFGPAEGGCGAFRRQAQPGPDFGGVEGALQVVVSGPGQPGEDGQPGAGEALNGADGGPVRFSAQAGTELGALLGRHGFSCCCSMLRRKGQLSSWWTRTMNTPLLTWVNVW